MKRLLVLAALLAAPGLVHAQGGPALHARTAGELAELCSQTGKEPAGAAKLNFCLGYAQGTFDTEIKRAGDKKPFCLPAQPPTRIATMGEFAQWVRTNAASGQPSHEALLRFMGQRFPCKP
jgi:hypothetical protein